MHAVQDEGLRDMGHLAVLGDPEPQVIVGGEAIAFVKQPDPPEDGPVDEDTTPVDEATAGKLQKA
jgi:hypothetical protein